MGVVNDSPADMKRFLTAEKARELVERRKSELTYAENMEVGRILQYVEAAARGGKYCTMPVVVELRLTTEVNRVIRELRRLGYVVLKNYEESGESLVITVTWKLDVKDIEGYEAYWGVSLEELEGGKEDE